MAEGGGSNSESSDSSIDYASFITDTIQGNTSALNSLASKADSTNDFLSNIWDSIKSGFTGIGDRLSTISHSLEALPTFLSTMWDSFTNTLKSLFIPSENYWNEGPLQQIKNTFMNKLGFIEGFKTAFGAMANTQGQTLNFEFEFMNHPCHIDFSWYEAHRLTIRSGIGTLFLVCGIMSALRTFLHALGVEISRRDN